MSAWAAYDAVSGQITATGVVTGVADPSYLALAPNGRTLYAVDEQEQGAVTALALSPDGPPRVLGTSPTGGAGPCHLSVHPGGRWLLSANYLGGSVAVHPLDRASGALGERTDLVAHSSPPPGPGQDGPHAHQIVTSPDGGHVLAVDLGNDTVYTLPAGRIGREAHPGGVCDAAARRRSPASDVPPLGRLRVSGERGRQHRRGLPLRPPQPAADARRCRSPRVPVRAPAIPAQILVTGDGRFAFLANRGHNSLTRYAVEAAGARLRLLDTVPVGGDFPRQIAFSPDQRWLFAANQKSGSVTVFAVDARTGALRSAGAPFAAPVPVLRPAAVSPTPPAATGTTPVHRPWTHGGR